MPAGLLRHLARTGLEFAVDRTSVGEPTAALSFGVAYVTSD